MRLLSVHNYSLSEFFGDDIPPYAVVSHRWEQDEPTLQDFEAATFRNKRGFAKVQEASRIAQRCQYDWVWIDTCCIDKRNAVELNEAINSMYQWYRDSRMCIAYLFDHIDGQTQFVDSTWFRRSWTLQELIAPDDVWFFDSHWSYIGTKKERCQEISDATRIDTEILYGFKNPNECSVAQRLSWAAERQATRPEDEAYSLLGIFGLSMPTLYGSGRTAFRNFQRELLEKHDHSIFAWDKYASGQQPEYTGLLADSPANFIACHRTVSSPPRLRSMEMVAEGIELEVLSLPYSLGVYLCVLDCTSTDESNWDGIFLQLLDGNHEYQQYARLIQPFGPMGSAISVSRRNVSEENGWRMRRFYVCHTVRYPPLSWCKGVQIRRLGFPGYDERELQSIQIYTRPDANDSPFGEYGRPLGDLSRPQTAWLPENMWGTVAVLVLPQQQSESRSWMIRCIRIGFDANFRPTIWIGSRNQDRTIRRMLSGSATSPTGRQQSRLWDNEWLFRDPVPLTWETGDGVTHVYSDRSQFERRGCEVRKALDENGLNMQIDHLRIRLRLNLEDLYNYTDRKIWTLDIRETRDFGDEHRSRKADRTLGKGLMAVGIIGAVMIAAKRHK